MTGSSASGVITSPLGSQTLARQAQGLGLHLRVPLPETRILRLGSWKQQWPWYWPKLLVPGGHCYVGLQGNVSKDGGFSFSDTLALFPQVQALQRLGRLYHHREWGLQEGSGHLRSWDPEAQSSRAGA